MSVFENYLEKQIDALKAGSGDLFSEVVHDGHDHTGIPGVGGGGGGGAEIIVANTVFSPASWVAKAKYTVNATDDASVPILAAIADLAVGGGGVGGGTVL